MDSRPGAYFRELNPDETFQQQQQQAVDDIPATQTATTTTSSATNTTTSSPRRKKAPLDIDTALRLQSQASYVQEPARASPGLGSSSGVSSTISGPISTAASTSTGAATCPPPAGISYGGLASCSAPSRSHHQQQQQQQQHANAARKQVAFSSCPCRDLDTNYYDHYYTQQHQRQQQRQSTISVDYIDCLSNNDLGRPLSASASDMRGLSQGTAGGSGAAGPTSSSRRHPPGRFHRSHRIEPSPQQQQQAITAAAGQALAASSSGDESPPRPAAGNGPRGHATSGDSASSQLTTTHTSNSTDCSSAAFEQQQAAAANSQQQQGSSSVLYPISVSEAKKRTYFIGSVSQDSLLGHDELLRYFPTGRVSIFVCTWNQNRKRAPLNLQDLLLPDQLVHVPDVYAVGIQEAYSSQADYLREWEIELQTTLGPSHVLLHSAALGSLHLALFIRRDLIWFCSQAEESHYNSRSMPTNMIKTKGAVSIAFRFFGTSFMFTNCHFPAHEHRLRDRIEEYQRIISSIDLPKNLKLLKPRYLSQDSTARFDCVFFLGDLNFRLEQRTFDETIQILDDIFQAPLTPTASAQAGTREHTGPASSSSLSYEALTQNDELLKVMESQQAFHGFDESQIRFPPTYKFLAQTNKYDRQTKRVPSYTDRILFRSKRRKHIQCLIYDWLPQLMSSDHKPVYSLFDVLIRPGHEQNMVSSLNAGLFQRAVYVEALKRRAEEPDGIRDNGAGGNLICSIT